MIYKYQIDRKGHVWELNDDGGVDIFALSDDIHNGPRCVNCGYDFCHHCIDTIEPCPAAKEARTPQDVEEFIAAHLREDPVTIDQYIDVDDLRAWMSGHVRVPVEVIESLRSHVFEGNVIRFGLRDTKASRRALADLLNASKGE